MEAFYDLAKHPVNFNYFDFLASAKAHGCTHVNISGSYKSKYPPEESANRLRSIINPGAALMGMTSGPGEGGFETGHMFPTSIKAWKETGRIGKCVSVLPPVKCKYTITLRDNPRHAYRNSKRDVWAQFAQEVGAVVIDEYDRQPIHLHERMALYAGAERNFFVSNGPAILCVYSDYPYTIFVTDCTESLLGNGIEFGWSPPWAIEGQRWKYSPPTLKNLLREVS